jgi:hypothetical protein
MLRLQHTLERLARLPGYRHLLHDQLPETARFNPGTASVLMGYDFHLTNDGPRLIEVNTNAGGGLFALHAALGTEPDLPFRLEQRLCAMFADALPTNNNGTRPLPQRLVILDDKPQEQFLYPEMQAFSRLFASWGIDANIVEPQQLEASAAGVFLDGKPVDLIYNRHCDFYLETDPLAGVRAAWLAGTVSLSPHPTAYGLLADKRRLCLFSDPDQLTAAGLDAAGIALLQRLVPESRLLADFDREALWKERKKWVFKPATSHASRGVLVGAKATRGRFTELDPQTTIVQRYVPPSLSAAGEDTPMKTDLRLFSWAGHALGLGARLYHGQVTNLRTEGGGFARIRLA